jgi:hypothetical protein
LPQGRILGHKTQSPHYAGFFIHVYGQKAATTGCIRHY